MGWIFLALVLAGAWYTHRYMRGEDLRAYDRPVGEWFDTTQVDAKTTAVINRRLGEMLGQANSTPGLRPRLQALREHMDKLSDGLVFDGQVETVDADGVSAEWVVARGADTSRRVLFLHGGAFAMGSPRGHRKMAAKLSQQAAAAVLSVDYRLWPEAHRDLALQDMRAAYAFMHRTGPQGTATAAQIIIAGDSAGGNLALVMAAWLRDQHRAGGQLPQADAVIAICPNVDSTLSGASIYYNANVDVILRDIARLRRYLPHGLFVLLASALYRMRIAQPEYSPVFGDLRNLPPTLVHAADQDILLSDAIRYTNKAQRDGSPVTLQVWRGQQHDFHLFADETLANRQAWEEIGAFLQAHNLAQQPVSRAG